MKRQVRWIILAAVALLGGCCAEGTFAQKVAAAAQKPKATVVEKPTPAVKADEVKMTSTTTVALSALSEKIQKNQKDFEDLMNSIPRSVADKIAANMQERDGLRAAVLAVEADIRAAHPGYHLDETSGKIVKDDAGAAAKP